ncbi:MAG: hypothetical protein WA936_01530 [Erythrobacter sp.]|uniref:hypothetical protein n=1 Tax=Erythrobacter sp. TaxID=1042 RepID=UPI003C791CA7
MSSSEKKLARLSAPMILAMAGMIAGGPILAQSDFSRELEALRNSASSSSSEPSEKEAGPVLDPTAIANTMKQQRNADIAAEKLRKIAAIRKQCSEAKTPLSKPRYPSAGMVIRASKDCAREFRNRFGHSTPDRSGWIRACRQHQEDSRRRSEQREKRKREIEYERQMERYESKLRAQQRQLQFCSASSAELAKGNLPAAEFPGWEKNDETRFLAALATLDSNLPPMPRRSNLDAKTREQEQVVLKLNDEENSRAEAARDANADMMAKLAERRDRQRRIAQCQAAIDAKYPGAVIVEGRDCSRPDTMTAQAYEISCSCATQTS